MSSILLGFAASAQEALFQAQNIVSPEVNDDNTVTFRLFAPNAQAVQVTGDFLPSIKMDTPMGQMDGPGKATLSKDSNGVWSFKTPVLNPELYAYSFVVDGFTATDPSNPFLIRDVGTATNFFLIGGGQGELYKTNDIPHGTVSRRWYDSPGLGMDRRLTVYTPPGYE
ncbi:MAG: hypothetical protein RLZ13_486, partial [Bacteroidota bacterium]